MDRRQALQRLAAGGGLALASSMVSSTPAFADSGTVACRHTYTASAAVSITVGRDALFGSDDEFFTLVQTAVPVGVCPCSASLPTITYSYRVFFSSPTSTGTRTATASGLSSLSTGQVQNGFTVGGTGVQNWNYDIQLGVYITCVGMTATPAVICRFVTVSGLTNLPIQAGSQFLGTFNLTATSAANLPGC